MLSIQNVTYTKCTYTKSYLYQMLPRQSVLDEMLLHENVLYETLMIPLNTLVGNPGLCGQIETLQTQYRIFQVNHREV